MTFSPIQLLSGLDMLLQRGFTLSSYGLCREVPDCDAAPKFQYGSMEETIEAAIIAQGITPLETQHRTVEFWIESTSGDRGWEVVSVRLTTNAKAVTEQLKAWRDRQNYKLSEIIDGEEVRYTITYGWNEEPNFGVR